ncbi:hypothetical protein O0L34_g11345 [Tuta absoluta]|nr:hypothetical protein O0L34_g11345 [Tuta absoluta]
MSMLPRKTYRYMVKWLLVLSTTAKIPHRQIALVSYCLHSLVVTTQRSQVGEVTGMMSMLPRKTYRYMVKWLLVLSTTAKIPHRQIALELLASLLSNEPEEESQPEPPPSDQTENTDAPMEGEDQPAKDGEETREEATPDGEPNSENQPPPTPSEDENSQDAENPDPDDAYMGFARTEPHTAPHQQILRAVYERVNDSSSTLRTRAFNVLTECLLSERAPMRHAIQELNGDGAVSRLMAVAARGVVDERAAVRRAALALVHRSLTARHTAEPTPEDLRILVLLCRDASIIVRSGAISAMGELTLQRPIPDVFDAFLLGPLRQLSDPETKVQEQVTKLVQELLVERLQRFSAGACEELLPWMFLAAVTRHNMRRHLLKACGILSHSTNCISIRLVDALSTHLAALSDERDLHALVMLTSVAGTCSTMRPDVFVVAPYSIRLVDALSTHLAALSDERDLHALVMLTSVAGTCSTMRPDVFVVAPYSIRLVDALSTHLAALSDERDLHALVMLTSVAGTCSTMRPDVFVVAPYSIRLVDALSTHLAALSDERDLHALVTLTSVTSTCSTMRSDVFIVAPYSIRLVDALSTHLAALSDERDLHALVMLTSVARHVQYNET